MRVKAFAVLGLVVALTGCPSPPPPAPKAEPAPRAIAKPAATAQPEAPRPVASSTPKPRPMFGKIDDEPASNATAAPSLEPAPREEPEAPKAEKKSRIPADAVTAKIVKCVDGDTVTVLLKGKEEKVRMKGVDTPETVHPQKPVERFGKEASNFTKQRLSGKTVKLELDNGGARDKYGRLLAFIWMEDGTCHNETLIAEGYAHAYTRYPFDRMEDYRKLEREAREQKRGLWGPD